MIHVVCGSQGGVGKTLISVLLAQYLRDHGKRVRTFDLDPFYGTCEKFKTLEVARPALWTESCFDLDAAPFDDLMEELLLNRDEVVVDVSSRAFLSWSHYLEANDWYPLFEEAGQSIWVHTAIVGGLRLRETVADLDYHANRLFPNCPLVVWLNGYFGPIVIKGHGFESFEVYETHQHRLQGLVHLPKWAEEACGWDFSCMLLARMTFSDCLTSDTWSELSKRHLRMMQQALYGQLHGILPSQALSKSGGRP